MHGNYEIFKALKLSTPLWHHSSQPAISWRNRAKFIVHIIHWQTINNNRTLSRHSFQRWQRKHPQQAQKLVTLLLAPRLSCLFRVFIIISSLAANNSNAKNVRWIISRAAQLRYLTTDGVLWLCSHRHLVWPICGKLY